MVHAKHMRTEGCLYPSCKITEFYIYNVFLGFVLLLLLIWTVSNQKKGCCTSQIELTFLCL